MYKKLFFCFVILATIATGCWDNVEYVFDCELGSVSSDASAGDADADSDADADATGEGQGLRPEGWEDFGSPCAVHDDCTGYPRSRCIDSSILGIINAPGGYCTACCDKPGEWCAEGVQCIGLDDGTIRYLICAATCNSDADCRTEDNWVCRKVPPYLDTTAFPGDFCLPDNDHIEANTDNPATDLECD
ncbi:MAG: hypothetical protein GY854_14615 [Deltaproteobacteria bacterium]|nr:hypothetical protein [Deltaproteobacteria bacterium]